MSILSLIPGVSELKLGAIMVVVLAVSAVVGVGVVDVHSFIEQARADHGAVVLITADRDRLAVEANGEHTLLLQAKADQERLAAINLAQHGSEAAIEKGFQSLTAKIAATPRTFACATSPSIRAAMGWPTPSAAPAKK